MEKRYLKEWVYNILILFQLINICILVSECSILWLFILSKIFALTMMITIHIIIERYTK